MKLHLSVSLLFMCVLFAVDPLEVQAQQCPPEFCDNVQQQVDAVCGELDSSHKGVFTEYPAGSCKYCYCPCKDGTMAPDAEDRWGNQGGGGAGHFFPDGWDELDPKSLKQMELDTSLTNTLAEKLVDLFRKAYPDIEIVIDYNASTRANARAEFNNGHRKVTIFYGLLRSKYMRLEGVSLFLAHEIAHHRGGYPRFSGTPSWWSSCEGQADYWAALVILRQMWPGEDYAILVKEGYAQMMALMQYGYKIGNLLNLKQDKSNLGACDHPPAPCRLKTFEAALYLQPKPLCAGPER